jgi:hypothetical protein
VNVQLQEVDVELLNRHAGLQAWRDSGEVSLLLLMGENMNKNDDNRSLLWLSPAALQNTADLRSSYDYPLLLGVASATQRISHQKGSIGPSALWCHQPAHEQQHRVL